MCCCNENSCNNNGSSGVFTQYIPVTMEYNITPLNVGDTNTSSRNGGTGLFGGSSNGRSFYNWSGYGNSGCGC